MAICPYCFNKINLNTLDLRCSSKTCLDPGTTNRHIIPRKYAKANRDGYGCCDICKRNTSILVCSACKHDLPDTIRDSETKIVSIVGAMGSGKSYFVATLLRQFMYNGLLAGINRASTRFCPGSREVYESRYKTNLDKCMPLSGTNFVTDIVKDNPPILTQFTYTNRKGKKVDNTYSFFDAAGESFKSAADLASVTPYIAHSEAIIIILDPRQLEKVNSKIKEAFPQLPDATGITYDEIVNSVADVVYSNLRLNRKKKIKIPLCVAFSKWDLMMNTPDLLPKDFMVSQPSKFSVSGFNQDFVENASSEIRSLLNDWDPNFVTTVENKFETVCYFGFSAWGLNSKDGNNPPPISSFRVEDPFLWIMNRNGLL